MKGDESGTQRDRKREEEEEINRCVSICSALSEVKNPLRFLASAFIGGGGSGGGGSGGSGVCVFFSFAF